MPPEEEDEDVIDRGDDFVATDEDELDDKDENLDEDEDENLDDDNETGDDDDDENEDIDQEDSEDEEADEEPEDSEDEDETDTSPRIPKSRLDEVIAQREREKETNQRLQDQLERLMGIVEKGQEKDEPEVEKFEYDFDAAEDAYMEAVLDGEQTKAKAIRKEVREAEKRMLKEEMETVRTSAVEGARGEAQKIRDQAKFEKTITTNEAKHPFLDQNHEDYNQAAVDKVNDLFSKFDKAGMTQADALQEAIDLVAPSFTKTTKAPTKKGLGNVRKKAALKKNASANNKQPPKLRGKTAKDNISDYDLANISDKEYAKLPASVKRKLRGD